MFHGQYLISGDTVYSPWISREGDLLRVHYDAIALGKGALCGLQVFHKNRQDTGPGTMAGTVTLNVSAVGVTGSEFSDLKEMVRYKMFCTSPTKGNYALFRILSPIWFDQVRASGNNV